MGADEKEGESALSINDAASGKIVGGQGYPYRIARDDADIVLAHLARQVGEDQVSAIFQFDPEHGIGQGFANDALYLDSFFLGHIAS